MLDLRVYRAAFVPALLCVVVAAFSLAAPPRAVTTTLAPDAFQGSRAFGTLRQLATAFPDRAPGSAGDQGLAREVANQFRLSGLAVSTRTREAQTIDGKRTVTDVIGVRPGSVSSRRLVVMAHRDAASRPSQAALSGTAGLLEL